MKAKECFEIDVTKEDKQESKTDKFLYNTRIKQKIPGLVLVDGPSIGIEVEVEGLPQPQKQEENSNLSAYVPRYWDIVEDGSLRDNGKEFVSHILSGVNILNAVVCLNEYLQKQKINKPVFTDRCSVHIHVDMLEEEVENIAKIILTYIYLEPILYLLPTIHNLPTRYKNNFCVPTVQTDKFYHYKGMIDALRNKAKSAHRSALRNIIENKDYKYQGFNVNSLAYHGTIEFRHFPGTSDPTIIISWVNVIFKLVSFAKKYTLTELIDILSDLNTSSAYHSVVYKAVGSLPIMYDSSLISQLEKSVKFIKLVTTSCQEVTPYNGNKQNIILKAFEIKGIKEVAHSEKIQYIKNLADSYKAAKIVGTSLTDKAMDYTGGIGKSLLEKYNKYIQEAHIFYRETNMVISVDHIKDCKERIRHCLIYPTIKDLAYSFTQDLSD